ncbi:MAG: hypothetical protein CMJ89_12295 [Planctomycetes bacterium]|nr:hypothetical protein [Planctomycetota bacterium]
MLQRGLLDPLPTRAAAEAAAPAAREQRIREGCAQLKKDIPEAGVLQLLGEPDERNETFDRVKRGVVTGHSLVYVIHREVEQGSMDEKEEVLLRIHFGPERRILSAHAVGIPDFAEIER